MATSLPADPQATHRASPRALAPAITRWCRSNVIVLLNAVLVVALVSSTSSFATEENLLNVLEQNTPLLIVAMGATLVIIAGGFDLSSGQFVSLSGVIGAKAALDLHNPLVGVLIGILVGVPAGCLNGLLVGRLRMNSFLATLATGLIFSGIALFVTSGYSFDLSSSNNFRYLGASRWLGIPLPVIVAGFVATVLSLLLTRTVFGRSVFAVGSNPEAARLSGLANARITLICYAIGGLCAGLAGMILTTRTGVGNVYGGANTMTLNAIAAVIIGGTSITGGRGSVWRTVGGVLLLALMANAFNLHNLQPYWQLLASGLIILIAVLANARAAEKAH